MISRVEVTRPATDPYLTDQSESVGSGRVGSGPEIFKISRIRSGRVKRLVNAVGRVGSGQEASRISRVGSDRLARTDST